MDWFDGRAMVREIPRNAIVECSRPGQDATEAVEYWTERLGFDAPEEYTREYLKSTGAWYEDELGDHTWNVQRLFWVICGNIREDPDTTVYLEG